MAVNGDKRWYVLVGGGSGGHVLPLKIIAEKLLNQEAESRVLIITDYKYYQRTEEIFKKLRAEFNEERLVLKKVRAGKLRRYSRGWGREVLDIKTQALNLRDLIKTLVGFLQAKMILLKYKPGVIFCKGGSSALEFCLAARKKAPIIVHDSDSRPGIANKIVGRYAKVFISGMPKSSNHKDLEEAVGVPVDEKFRVYSEKEKKVLKKKLSLESSEKIVLVTGGGLGAMRINRLVVETIATLTKLKITVLHQTGRAEETALAKKVRAKLKEPKLYRPFDFSSEMADLYAVADVVVARAGATTIQEIANSKKAAILIPAKLTDQVKNGRIMDELGAAIVLDGDELEKDPASLVASIQFILEDEGFRNNLLSCLEKLEKRDTAEEIVIKLREGYLK
jgi:UDP-N-acetylglucosamine--N-acetylmuramyl-(pentapeptide) pyrophosphoryl-undecaprenol N-acetylglucosamine transferase